MAFLFNAPTRTTQQASHDIVYLPRQTCPHQCYFPFSGGGSEGFQAHTCPFCGVLGFSATDLIAHVDSCGEQGASGFEQVGEVGMVICGGVGRVRAGS